MSKSCYSSLSCPWVFQIKINLLNSSYHSMWFEFCSQFSSVAWAYHQHFIEIFSIFLLTKLIAHGTLNIIGYFWDSKRPFLCRTGDGRDGGRVDLCIIKLCIAVTRFTVSIMHCIVPVIHLLYCNITSLWISKWWIPKLPVLNLQVFNFITSQGYHITSLQSLCWTQFELSY